MAINLDNYLEDLRERGFYGEVILIFENGKVRRIKTTESHIVISTEDE